MAESSDTNSRRRFIWISFSAFLFFLFLFLLAVLGFDTPYTLRLIIWFLVTLFACHWYFSTRKNLRRLHLALIDYLYLGATVLGLLFLSSYYSEQRESSYKKYNEFYLEIAERQHREELRIPLRIYFSDTCTQGKGISRLAVHCALAAELQSFMEETIPIEKVADRLLKINGLVAIAADAERKKITEAFALLQALESEPAAARPELKRKLDDLRRSSILGGFESVTANFRKIAQDMEERAKNAPRSSASANLLSIILGIGYTAIWPYILILALALRLTKVTIEMAEWIS